MMRIAAYAPNYNYHISTCSDCNININDRRITILYLVIIAILIRIIVLAWTSSDTLLFIFSILAVVFVLAVWYRARRRQLVVDTRSHHDPEQVNTEVSLMMRNMQDTYLVQNARHRAETASILQELMQFSETFIFSSYIVKRGKSSPESVNIRTTKPISASVSSSSLHSQQEHSCVIASFVSRVFDIRVPCPMTDNIATPAGNTSATESINYGDDGNHTTGLPAPTLDLTYLDINCSVCLLDYSEGDDLIQLRCCRHIFHKKCLTQWLECRVRQASARQLESGNQNLQVSCPLCKRLAGETYSSPTPGAPIPTDFSETVTSDSRRLQTENAYEEKIDFPDTTTTMTNDLSIASLQSQDTIGGLIPATATHRQDEGVTSPV